MARWWERHADVVLSALKSESLAGQATVVLVGSAARRARTWRSDVDILLLLPEGERLSLRPATDLHLQQESYESFLERLEGGEDYPAWALRFGIPLRDPQGWWAAQTKREDNQPHWPKWTLKISLAEKRLGITAQLVEMGDEEAAAEELLYAASQVARAILLREGTFPLARSEMPGQLPAMDKELGRALKRLIKGDARLEELSSIERTVRSRLDSLKTLADATA